MASFLLEQERAYCGASSFFIKMARLGIDPVLYEKEFPHIFGPLELNYYVDSILNDLRGKPLNEDYEYVRRVCQSLKGWADKNYIVHFIE